LIEGMAATSGAGDGILHHILWRSSGHRGDRRNRIRVLIRVLDFAN
jgi:hypothetical protein